MVHAAITGNDMDNLRMIYKSADIIRRSFRDFTCTRNPMQVSSTIDDVPIELYTLLRWITVWLDLYKT